ncbi:helix-turn-helix domain-containing protein [Bacillus sp. B1-b2]|uniref:AraC family transcriptional regulator n=1 Tax=Bacillus sp. B1-b2 TaxID=2653201 RepID=UPI001261BBC0|nr:AraC family transcriptional regulator [Bacillus sp. B1-b2]KAB7670774.1 AraC family transcriptional regulator [Bacillus sp. B1-b2]
MGKGSLSHFSDGRLYPKVTAYYFREWNGFHMPSHSHAAIEIMYVISGECLVEVKKEKLNLKKSQFILIDSQIPHKLIVNKDQPCRMLNIEFILTEMQRTFPTLYELAQENEELHELLTNKQSYYLLRDRNEVFQSLRNLVLELDKRWNKDKDNYLMVHILISQLLVLIARNLLETKQDSNQQTGIYLKKVMEYLHENYDYEIKMDHLSAITHLHPNYLHRIFKESTGCTIIDYLTKIRIEKAKMLITQTDIPITKISSFVGMNSSQYFSKVFKKYTGTTPTALRRASTYAKGMWTK